MRITSKGQVTIPIAIRERFGLLPDTDVEFIVEDDAVKLRPLENAAVDRARAAVARIRGTGSGKLSTDQILALMRGR